MFVPALAFKSMSEEQTFIRYSDATELYRLGTRQCSVCLHCDNSMVIPPQIHHLPIDQENTSLRKVEEGYKREKRLTLVTISFEALQMRSQIWMPNGAKCLDGGFQEFQPHNELPRNDTQPVSNLLFCHRSIEFLATVILQQQAGRNLKKKT